MRSLAPSLLLIIGLGCVVVNLAFWHDRRLAIPYKGQEEPNSGGDLVDGPGRMARFNRPSAVAVDSTGNLFVADYLNDAIRKITPAGMVATLTARRAERRGNSDGATRPARLEYGPAGIAVDQAGNLYVADYLGHTVRKVNTNGDVTILAGSAENPGNIDGPSNVARFNQPIGVAVDREGNVIVADQFSRTIRRISATGNVTTLAGNQNSFGSADGTGSAASFQGLGGIAVDTAGNVLIADYYNHTIRKASPVGEVTTLAGRAGQHGSVDGPRGAARFYAPSGVAVDKTGNVFVADYDNHTIRKVSVEGVVTTLAGQAKIPGGADGRGNTARFNYPRGVAVDSAGNVFVADQLNCTIRKVDPAGIVTTLAGRPSSLK